MYKRITFSPDLKFPKNIKWELGFLKKLLQKFNFYINKKKIIKNKTMTLHELFDNNIRCESHIQMIV